MYGARIRELRKERGWTMKQLGQRLNLAESTISGYENEIRRPDMDILIRFAELFDVSVDYVLGRSSERKPSASASAKTKEAPAAYTFTGADGRMETLTADEAKHLAETLEMYRLWKAKKQES